MPAQSISLLIVEDNPVYAEILQRLLPTISHDFQFTINWMDTAEKALVELDRKAYGLVLLDYKLPGADGLTVLANIRQRPEGDQPAVIMLTGIGREDIAVQAMKSGAKDYLAKDALDVASLLRAITSALERKNLETKLARSTRELREKNAQLEADLTIAREIQLSFLPQTHPVFPASAPAVESALTFHHRYHPTAAIGGDFYDILQLSDTAAGVFICDVMGHGVRAALITAVIRGLLEELKPAGADPGRFLTLINRALISVLRNTRVPTFASAFYLVADTARAEVRYANAGHPMPYFLHRAKKTVENLCTTDFTHGSALGVFNDSTYNTAARPITPGDAIILYTDGLFEVPGADGVHFGEARLFETVQRHSQLPPTELLNNIFQQVQIYSGTNGFLDDVCLVDVEIKHL